MDEESTAEYLTSMSEAPFSTEHKMYLALMGEVRLRMLALEREINIRNRWEPWMLEEFGYLQLRLTCESIALACLIAHGDVTRKKTLKLDQPPEIMRRLEEITPNFFPRPGQLWIINGHPQLQQTTQPALSKRELIQLWRRSSDYLHRGTAEGLQAERGKDFSVDLEVFTAYIHKIRSLLETHAILGADNKHQLIVHISHGPGEHATVIVRKLEGS
jgi:hypothetical protein